ncbi:MAG: DHHA1 domain-containing protein [Acidobacteriota bacterium]
MTEKLFWLNPYEKEFEAEILENLEINGKKALILNRTLFYPESGGQPSDKGWIDGIEVYDVKEEDSKIFHYVKDFPRKKLIRGKIDWERRYDHMQQHTGQHILSESFIKLLNAETLSFHLGEEISTIEINLRKIDWEKVYEVENLSNSIIYENRKVKVYFIKRNEIGENIRLRKIPEDVENLRIVEIENFDFSACGGTHLKRTGEVGIIKVLKWEKIRDNFRFEFLCGKRALKDYYLKNKLLKEIADSFSVKDLEVKNAIERLKEELKSFRKKSEEIENRLIEYEAFDIEKEGEKGIIKKIFYNRDPKKIKYLALNLIKRGNYVVLFGVKSEKVYVILACSENIPLDLREFTPKISQTIEGKGGGSRTLIEVAGPKRESLEELLDEIKISLQIQ